MKINFDIRKLQKSNKDTSWQKALFLALVTGVIIISASYVYLIVKPISPAMKNIIDEEISAVDIIFSQKTLESIKARQEPAEVKLPVSGKNPFAGF